MAKDITIQEGGVDKRLNAVRKLRTQLQAGGTCDWIPQSELGTKTVTDRGTYAASADGYYGFTRFTVNIDNADVKHY